MCAAPVVLLDGEVVGISDDATDWMDTYTTTTEGDGGIVVS
jgi:hypothetical protein